MDWIDLSQDMDKWWTVLKTAVNRRVPKNAGSFLLS